MKISVILLLVIGLACQASVRAADNPHVTVFGTATSKVKPDMLRWYVTISDKGAELPALSELHTSHAAALLRLLKEKAIRAEETQTSGMRFTENREYRANSWIKDGFIATTQVSFTMRNVDDYQETWLALARLASVSVESVTWDVSSRIEMQNTTRIEALRSAKIKAEQMASALGTKISEPIAIEEVIAENPWETRAMMYNSAQEPAPQAETSDAVAPGAVSIRARVRVVFQLVTP